MGGRPVGPIPSSEINYYIQSYLSYISLMVDKILSNRENTCAEYDGYVKNNCF